MFDITAFTKPLDSKLYSVYIEQLSFLLLKHIFPQILSEFFLNNAPDLQGKDRSVGIEITEAVAPEIAQIDGEYAKLRLGKKTEYEKEKCKLLIKKNGGEVDSIGLSYPVTNSSATGFKMSSERRISNARHGRFHEYKCTGGGSSGSRILLLDFFAPFLLCLGSLSQKQVSLL